VRRLATTAALAVAVATASCIAGVGWHRCGDGQRHVDHRRARLARRDDRVVRRTDGRGVSADNVAEIQANLPTMRPRPARRSTSNRAWHSHGGPQRRTLHTVPVGAVSDPSGGFSDEHDRRGRSWAVTAGREREDRCRALGQPQHTVLAWCAFLGEL
jgi:hypothetical protein